MLITITDHNQLQIIDIAKDDNYRLIGSGASINLFDVIDDLLSIDWIRMASDLFYNVGDLWIEQEFDEEYPFSDYDTFHEWISAHNCLYKESLSEVTFDLLKTQFPRFTIESWDRFYNALIFLNTEGFFSDLPPFERRDLFFKMFPKVNFFSPFRQFDSDPIKMVSSFVFSSNLEMLIYDILKDIYISEDEHCTEKEIVDFCSFLVNTFRTRKNIAEELDYIYTVEKFIEDYFSGPCYKSISSDTYSHIEILLHILNSNDLRTHLFVEFRMSEQDLTRYGQEKLPISYFVDSDLIDRFKCKAYIYECYAKYEITGIDIFNINAEINLILLLGLYASAFSNLSFGKCNTCGHYFVRNINNRSQIQCDRCKEYVSQFIDVTEILQQAERINTNSYTALCRMKADSENKRSRFYELIDGNKQVLELYKKMIKEYRHKIDDVILLLSQEHILFRYDIMDLYGYAELKNQIDQEKELVPIHSSQHGMIDFDFFEFYNDYLIKKRFFLAFEYLNEASKDTALYSKAILHFQLTFSKMRSIFYSYGLNVDSIIEIQNDFISIIENCMSDELR